MEGCASVLQQRHYADVEAFAEQMRRKDEKLEAYRWRVLTAELQSERLQSQVEGLEGKLSSLREESTKLEDLLLDREEELRSLKKQISLQLQYCRKSDSNRSRASSPSDSRSLWSEVNRKGQEDPEESEAGGSTPVLKDQRRPINGVKQMMASQQEETRKCGETAKDAARTGSSTPPPFSHHYVASDRQRWKFPSGSEIFDKIQGSGLTALGKDTSRKVDLHALGISYKIKRLKQQLLAFEQLAGVQAPQQVTCRDGDLPPDEQEQRQKGFFLQVMPLLNKQARKYRSLEEKADGLCRRMVRIRLRTYFLSSR